MYYLYDETGQYQGCTFTPADFPELNNTQIEPPYFDEFDEMIYFVDGAWEIRSI